MSKIFKKHLEKFVDINDSEFLDILAFFQVAKVRKKENLLVEGQVCKFHYFVLICKSKNKTQIKHFS